MPAVQGDAAKRPRAAFTPLQPDHFEMSLPVFRSSHEAKQTVFRDEFVPVSVSFSSDVKVQIKSMESRFYCYPDVTVDSSNVRGDSLFAETPRIVFEVLSPQTERIDRAEKLANYQTISTLHAYVLVDQFHRFITVYRRTGSSGSNELFERTQTLQLPEIGRRCRSNSSRSVPTRLDRRFLFRSRAERSVTV